MKMKRFTIAAAVVSLLAAGALSPQARADGISGDIGVYSQYVWRGVTQTSGKTAVQGDLGYSSGGLSAGVWFSNAYPASAPQYAGRDVVEFDWTLDYSTAFSGVGVSVGAIGYTYLYDSGSNFPEVYLGVSLDAPLAPSLTVYYTASDSNSKFYRAGDMWIDLAVSTSAAGFDLGATLAYVNWKNAAGRTADQWKDGLSALALSVSKGVKLGDADASVSLSWSQPLAGKAADGNRYIYGAAAKSEFVAGVNFAF
ncbi:MAG: TorF family putative porin [Mariprofundaceae bacterium]